MPLRPAAGFVPGAAVAMVGDGADTGSVNAARSYNPATVVARAWAKHYHVGGQWSLSLS
jgi:hypothetical protein